jgi:hypothetical protein
VDWLSSHLEGFYSSSEQWSYWLPADNRIHLAHGDPQEELQGKDGQEAAQLSNVFCIAMQHPIRIQ